MHVWWGKTVRKEGRSCARKRIQNPDAEGLDVGREANVVFKLCIAYRRGSIPSSFKLYKKRRGMKKRNDKEKKKMKRENEGKRRAGKKKRREKQKKREKKRNKKRKKERR